MIRGLARTAGVEHAVFAHALRHGFVTAALDAGVSLHRIRDAAPATATPGRPAASTVRVVASTTMPPTSRRTSNKVSAG